MSGNQHGSKWIRPEKRAAIYTRDFHCCVYCGPVPLASLSLDHLRPRSKRGSNDATNLVTCCLRCNRARQSHRSVRAFCIAVAAYTGQDWRAVQARVRAAARRAL